MFAYFSRKAVKEMCRSFNKLHSSMRMAIDNLQIPLQTAVHVDLEIMDSSVLLGEHLYAIAAIIQRAISPPHSQVHQI